MYSVLFGLKDTSHFSAHADILTKSLLMVYDASSGESTII